VSNESLFAKSIDKRWNDAHESVVRRQFAKKGPTAFLGVAVRCWFAAVVLAPSSPSPLKALSATAVTYKGSISQRFGWYL
jgi:hypothetical protein